MPDQALPKQPDPRRWRSDPKWWSRLCLNKLDKYQPRLKRSGSKSMALVRQRCLSGKRKDRGLSVLAGKIRMWIWSTKSQRIRKTKKTDPEHRNKSRRKPVLQIRHVCPGSTTKNLTIFKRLLETRSGMFFSDPGSQVRFFSHSGSRGKNTNSQIRIHNT